MASVRPDSFHRSNIIPEAYKLSSRAAISFTLRGHEECFQMVALLLSGGKCTNSAMDDINDILEVHEQQK